MCKRHTTVEYRCIHRLRICWGHTFLLRLYEFNLSIKDMHRKLLDLFDKLALIFWGHVGTMLTVHNHFKAPTSAILKGQDRFGLNWWNSTAFDFVSIVRNILARPRIIDPLVPEKISNSFFFTYMDMVAIFVIWSRSHTWS